MGSGTTPTTTASDAPVQTNKISFTDLPPISEPPASFERDLSLVLPLTDITEAVWERVEPAESLVVIQADGMRLEVRAGNAVLGLVPPQYVETVLERQLFVGRVEIRGAAPPDLRVRLFPVA